MSDRVDLPTLLLLKLLAVLIVLVGSCAVSANRAPHLAARDILYAPVAPVIDGNGDDLSWLLAPWRRLEYLIAGSAAAAEDFSGRYKLLWREEGLYLLLEIRDDIHYDAHPDPTDSYWNDDCVEVFIDENASGGEHTRSHNAFAYHVALDGQVVDIGTNGLAQTYNQHIRSRWQREQDLTTWELSVRIFPDTYVDVVDDGREKAASLAPEGGDNAGEGESTNVVSPDGGTGENSAQKLQAGRQMGFMLAYCDNDKSAKREHFYGSVFIPGEDKNVGWKVADVFERIRLAPPPRELPAKKPQQASPVHADAEQPFSIEATKNLPVNNE